MKLRSSLKIIDIENVLGVFFKYEKSFILVASVLICIFSSIVLGQDANWDSLNYHYYNAYSFLNGRMGWDIAPANMQTWFNPALDVPILWMTLHLPAPLVSASLAALAAGNVVLSYWIARAVLGWPTDGIQRITATGIALVSCALTFWSPMFISELGTTFGDNLGSLAVVAALYTVLRSGFSVKSYFWAGLWLGIAMSVKLTNANAVIAFVVATTAMFLRPAAWLAGLIRLAASGLGALVTFLPVGGAWLAYIYSRYGNPTFPIYNNVFHSEFYAPLSMTDARFVPGTFWDIISFLPRIAMGDHPSAEVYYRDVRACIAVIAILVFVVLASSRRIRFQDGFSLKNLTFVIVFYVAFLAVWLNFFGIARYALVLDQLAPFISLAVASLLPWPGGAVRSLIAILVLGMVIATQPANWGRVAQGWDWFAFDVPVAARTEGVLYVLHSTDAEAFVALALPASARLVRINGNMPLDPTVGLGLQARAVIVGHSGPIRTLANTDAEGRLDEAYLTRFGVGFDAGPCFDIGSRLATIRSCPLKRIGPS